MHNPSIHHSSVIYNPSLIIHPCALCSPTCLVLFLHVPAGCETLMDIVIVLDGSNSIYPWYEVQNFLITVLQKFYIGPGQTQVGSSHTSI